MIDYEALILDAMGSAGPGAGGLLTGDIAKKVRPMFGSNTSQHSAFIRQRLLTLESEGRVRKLDDLKPVCWVRVAK